MTYHLHLGILDTDYERFISQFVATAEVSDAYRVFHGTQISNYAVDSWEQWGESLWDFDEDHRTYSDAGGTLLPVAGLERGRHVVIAVDNDAEGHAAIALIQAQGYRLMPMLFKNQVGTIACLSETEDWAEKRWYVSLEHNVAAYLAELDA